MNLLCLLLAPIVVAQTIVDIAVSSPAHTTLVSVLTDENYADILGVLGSDGPFTVFAPTNDAFEAAGVDTSDVDAVKEVLKYHVISGKIMSGDLAPYQAPATVQGRKAVVVSNEDGVFVNGAQVIAADLEATNGVVHVVDQVLLPPSQSIVDLAVGEPSVSTLVSVLTTEAYKPVLDALSGDSMLTVLAPTNDAFAAAGVDVSDVEAVTNVLQYHVIAGEILGADLAFGENTPIALNGNTLNVVRSETGVTVNDANVVGGDILATNGVVHLIDKVLLPPVDVQLPPVAAETEEAPAASPAVVAPRVSAFNGNLMSYGNRLLNTGLNTFNTAVRSTALPYRTTAPIATSNFGVNNFGYNSLGYLNTGLNTFNTAPVVRGTTLPYRTSAPVATSNLFSNYGYNNIGYNNFGYNNFGYNNFGYNNAWNYAPARTTALPYRTAAPVATRAASTFAAPLNYNYNYGLNTARVTTLPYRTAAPVATRTAPTFAAPLNYNYGLSSAYSYGSPSYLPSYFSG